MMILEAFPIAQHPPEHLLHEILCIVRPHAHVAEVTEQRISMAGKQGVHGLKRSGANRLHQLIVTGFVHTDLKVGKAWIAYVEEYRVAAKRLPKKFHNAKRLLPESVASSLSGPG